MNPLRILLLIITLAALGTCITARAQGTRDRLPAHGGGTPVVSLLTCAPGELVYELEGHTALRIQHPRLGDFTVNWGVFDFASPNFLYRFVKGETDYMAAATDTWRFTDSYRRHGRTVREQTLRLDSLQAERLTALVLDNLRPERRVYRYNYVLDNCATRPLAMIERALGDTLTLGPSPLRHTGGDDTFRGAMRHYHSNYPWYQFGIDTALGQGIDRPVSERETAFSPLALAAMVQAATLPEGEPLVVADGYLWGDASTPAVTLGPTPWYLTPMAAALAVLALAIWVSAAQLKGHARLARWADTVWFTLLGLEGMLLTFLIFVSVHESTSPNWLYLWLNPLCLAGAISPWLKGRARCLEIWYQSANFALLTALALIFALGVQSPNPAFWPLMAATALRAMCDVYCTARAMRRTPLRHSGAQRHI